MVLILLGPPGVGKGTQGVLLAESLGWDRLVTGDVLRSARREGTELGEKARVYMDRGDLVPDDLIVALVEERLHEIPDDRGVLFDGFPRTVPQAQALDAALRRSGRRMDGVVLLEAPDDVLVRRISGRRSCPQCGRIYNVNFDPPISEGICDECGARLDHRKDDSAETVRHRLGVYREMTHPLVEYYESGEAPVLRVDGDDTVDRVRRKVWRALVEELEVEA